MRVAHNLCNQPFSFLVSCAVAQAVLDIDKGKHKTTITTPDYNESKVEDNTTHEQSMHLPNDSGAPEQSHITDTDLNGVTGMEENSAVEDDPTPKQNTTDTTEVPAFTNEQNIADNVQNYDLLEEHEECNKTYHTPMTSQTSLPEDNPACTDYGLNGNATPLVQKTNEQEQTTEMAGSSTYTYNDGDSEEKMYTQNDVIPSTSQAGVMDHEYSAVPYNTAPTSESENKPNPNLGYTEYRKQYLATHLFGTPNTNDIFDTPALENGVQNGMEGLMFTVDPKICDNQQVNGVAPFQEDPNMNFREIVSAASSGSGYSLNQRFSVGAAMSPQEDTTKTEWAQPLSNVMGLGKTDGEQGLLQCPSMSKTDIESNSTVSAAESLPTNEEEKKKTRKRGRKKKTETAEPKVKYDTRSKKKK